MISKLLLPFLGMCAALGLTAQTDLKFTHLREGLNHSSVTTLEQDRLGYIWIGTLNGLHRYDGGDMTLFEPHSRPGSKGYIQDAHILHLLATRDGSVWAGTAGGGLNRFHQQGGYFERMKFWQEETPVSAIYVDHIRITSGQTGEVSKIWDFEDDHSLEDWSVLDGHIGLDSGLASSGSRSVRIAGNTEGKEFYFQTQAFKNLNAGDTIHFDVYMPDWRRQHSIQLYSHHGDSWTWESDWITPQQARTWGTYRYVVPESTDDPVSFGVQMVPSGDDPLTVNSIYSITEDNQGHLWMATNSGILKYDPRSDRVVGKYFHAHWTATYCDSDGHVWLGGPRLLRMAPGGSVTDHTPAGLSGFVQLTEDHNGHIWAATASQGVLQLKPQAGGEYTQKHYTSAGPEITLASKAPLAILADSHGSVWIGYDNAGVNRIFPATGEVRHYTQDLLNDVGLSDLSVWALMEDRDGRIWAGTYKSGVNIYDPHDKNFYSFSYRYQAPNSLIYDNVRALAERGDGKLWLGTDGGGLNLFDPETATFTPFAHDPADPHSLAADYVLTILPDGEKNAWFGTWSGGLDYYDARSGRFVHHRHDPEDPHSISDNNVFRVVRDHREPDNLWLATFNGGLDYYDAFTGRFQNFDYSSGDVGARMAHSLGYDADRNLWIGTSNGIFKVTGSPESSLRFQSYVTNTRDSTSSLVNCFFTDSRGHFWAGTTGDGLLLYDPQSDRFRRFRQNHGLPNNTVVSINEDGQGDLWVGTVKGLTKIQVMGSGRQVDSLECVTFTAEDGLNNDHFRINASLKTSSGKLYFGNQDGFVYFDPSEIGENKLAPPVHITGGKVLIPSEEGSEFEERSLLNQQRLVLAHDQSIFTIEFVALNYTHPLHNQYAYMMEGASGDWHHIGNQRSVTFTGLAPGEYTFHVKAANNDGVWNDTGASLEVIITPPFWGTPWFRALLIIGLVLAVAAIIHWRTRAITTHRRELEHRVQKRTRELQEEINIRRKAEVDLKTARDLAEKASKSKSEFLANMSHEIRTPMNGIMGMTELALESGLNKKQKDYLKVVMQSSESLLSIINDILDYSKIEAGKLEIHETQVNLVELIESVVSSFSIQASKKDLELICELSPEVPALVMLDPVRMRQILTNLIGNALKFTEKGEVHVKVTSEPLTQQHDQPTYPLHISVTDTGIGIPQDKLTHIFKSFSQADSSTTRNFGGTGLGLTISQKLIHMMHGSIQVESQQGKGSTFSIHLPCKASQNSRLIKHSVLAQIDLEGRHFLVVDDNQTNCHLLQELLTDQGASVSLAFTASQALQYLNSPTSQADFILLDHQMPDVDGLDMARIIRKKDQWKTARIILLSSIADTQQQDEYTLAGIDGALTKPIKRGELLSLISEVSHIRPSLSDALLVPEEPDEASQNHQHNGTQNTGTLTALVAEDNIVNQTVARNYLKKLGVEPTIAEDGQVAARLLAEKTYDLIFMDIQMPHKNGYEVTKEVKAGYGPNAQTPIIAMTAYAMSGDKQKCLDAGMDDYISKPINMEGLKTTIQKWRTEEVKVG